MNDTPRAADGDGFERLAGQAIAVAARYCRARPHLDRDAAESVALAAVVEAKRRWEEGRAKLADFVALVIESRLLDAAREGRLYGDADARRLNAVSLYDLDPAADDEPGYYDAATEAVDVDDFVGGLPLSAADRELLRERVDGDRRTAGRADRTKAETQAALRRIRRAATDTLTRGTTKCSH